MEVKIGGNLRGGGREEGIEEEEWDVIKKLSLSLFLILSLFLSPVQSLSLITGKKKKKKR